VAARTIEFLDDHAQSNQDEPFVLAIGMMLPHQPFVATKADYDEYKGKVPPPKNPKSFDEETHPYLKWWKSHAGLEDVTPEEVERTRTAYYALVTRLDSLLGDIFNTLEKHGLLDNTLIIYTSCAGGAHHGGINDWPFVLVGGLGGKLKTGRYLQYPSYGSVGHKSIANLYMSIMAAADTPYGDHFGQVDPGLRDLDVAGPLAELLA